MAHGFESDVWKAGEGHMTIDIVERMAFSKAGISGAASVESARRISRQLALDADKADRAACFPHAMMGLLHQSGLAMAPFPRQYGGADLMAPSAAGVLFEVLRTLGGGDLSVGRLYEGHVNAVALVARYGTPQQLGALADEVRNGAWSGVWSADDGMGLTLERKGDRWGLLGRKVLCSGAGALTRPVVVARATDGPILILLRLEQGERADLSAWTPLGMRSTATGSVQCCGLTIGTEDMVGKPGDYLREPFYRGGGWRFCAVQLGAIETLIDLYKAHLHLTRRISDPFQQQRVAQCAAAAYGAHLGTERAARVTSVPDAFAPDAVATTGLTRILVERAGMEVIDHVQRGVGLRALVQPNPIERVIRDLSTYLRQPTPDTAMTDAAGHILARSGPLRHLWAWEDVA